MKQFYNDEGVMVLFARTNKFALQTEMKITIITIMSSRNPQTMKLREEKFSSRCAGSEPGAFRAHILVYFWLRHFEEDKKLC